MPAVAATHEIRWRLAGSQGAWQSKVAPATSSFITLDGLERGKEYEGEARSLSAAGTPSDWVAVEFVVADASMAPPVPQNLTAEGVADGISLRFEVAAQLPADVEVCIERAAAELGPFTEITRVRALQYTDPITNTDTHWYRVRNATYGQVYSEYSNAVEAIATSVSGLVDDVAAALAAAVEAQQAVDQEVADRFEADANAAAATAAGLAQVAADAATAALAQQAEIDAARAAVTEAEARIRQITDDEIISQAEKPQLIIDFGAITDEYSGILAEADLSEVVDEKAAYGTAFDALANYMNTLTTPVPWNNTTDYTDLT